MSEEIALAIGDIAYWQQRAERAEADAAQLMSIVLDAAVWLDQLPSADGSGHHDLAHRLREIIDTRQYSGAQVLADLAAFRQALECLLAGPTDAAQDRARAALAMTEGSAG